MGSSSIAGASRLPFVPRQSATHEGNGEESTMNDAPEAASRLSNQDANVTRRHEDERQRAAKDVAERNRKAHEAAVRSRAERRAVLDDLKRGLSF